MRHGEGSGWRPLCKGSQLLTRHPAARPTASLPWLTGREFLCRQMQMLCLLNFCLTQTLKQTTGKKAFVCSWKDFTTHPETILQLNPSCCPNLGLFDPELSSLDMLNQQKAILVEKNGQFSVRFVSWTGPGQGVSVKDTAMKWRPGQGPEQKGMGGRGHGQEYELSPFLTGFGLYTGSTVTCDFTLISSWNKEESIFWFKYI